MCKAGGPRTEIEKHWLKPLHHMKGATICLLDVNEYLFEFECI